MAAVYLKFVKILSKVSFPLHNAVSISVHTNNGNNYNQYRIINVDVS